MVLAGPVCVDRYEDQLVVRGAAGSIHVHLWYERPRSGVTYVARSRAGVFPQAYVNRFESAAACLAAHKRLCTLREWFSACRGGHRTAYPYGPREHAGVCNSGKPHLLGRFHGESPGLWSYRYAFNDPRLDQVPGFLAHTGAYSRCVTDAGLYDMVGNLHEWVSDTIEPTASSVVPVSHALLARLDRQAGHGVFMGGFYSTRDEHGNGCGFVTIGHQPSYHDYSTGFRCCRDPAARASGG
jgi:formylglycine-generating enzyme required for sulfatase activity